MGKIMIAVLNVAALLTTAHAQEPLERGGTRSLPARPWPEKRAADWYRQVGRLRGCNYVPRTAVNSTELWQHDMLHADGSPYDSRETDLIRRFASNTGSQATAIGSTESLRTRSLVLGIQEGVVTAFTDWRTQETYAEKTPAALTGLRRLKGRHLWNDNALVRTKRDEDGLTVTATWAEDDGESQVVTHIRPQSNGDVIFTQRAGAAAPGLVGVQWGLLVPESWEVFVPGYSGLRFSAETACGHQQFEYPMTWEAQFVLIQGKRGGMLIHAQDNAGRFKTLHLDKRDGRFLIGLETHCTAPFEPITETTSVRWRVHAYQGDWLAGACVYRTWAAKTFGLMSITEHRPAWVKDIQFVVIADLNQKLLSALARQVEPRQTLVYVPNWRRDGYDRNYPDYTAREDLDQQIKQAHDLGFRVMLHVNYFGVTPENPHYQKLKQYHCINPFTNEHMYWDWRRATPPIKFAYINPAARAWRELFVSLMVDLCDKLNPDALHLDQTLCIFNDAHGPIDGLNMMQGNLALHRELRQALPDVALSGEGLNEITCRAESFAQRHVFGVNHTDRLWNEALIAQIHPISSALLTPYTTLYGYLGMPTPQTGDYYFAWRRAHERFGVIPTLARPSHQQVTEPEPAIRVLLDEARWFQENRPRPDFTPPWAPETLFAYRTADGGRAEYRQDAHGVVFAVLSPQPRVVSRRIAGVTSARLPGNIPNWRAYDDERLLGLNPNRSYLYLNEPRDRDTFHVRALPETVSVQRIGLRPELIVLCLDDRRRVVANLWEFVGPTRCGERLPDGTTQQTNGCMFTSQAGTDIRPEGDKIFAHPPWRSEYAGDEGAAETTVLGTAWIEFDLGLPSDKPARFETGIGLRSEQAMEGSDGVTFRVAARAKGLPQEPITFERHVRCASPEPVCLDLSGLRSRAVTVRLETHPGPAGSASFDWATWTRPRIVVTEPYRAQIEVASPHPILGVIAGENQDGPTHKEGNRYKLTVGLPGTTYLLLRPPHKVRPPVELRELPFGQALIFGDGTEQAPHGFLHAKLQADIVGGVTKQGLFAHPPSQGEAHLDFLLALPDKPARLIGFAGIRDGAEGKSQGVGFRIAVNGQPQWCRDLQPDGKWAPFDVPLAGFTGQTVVLTLITDALGNCICDWAQWGQPELVPGP